MKKLILAIMASVLLTPALSSAAVLDFGTGNGGLGGTMTLLGSGDLLGTDILIGRLTVSGTAADGGYDVGGGLACGTVDGTCGALSFDTAAGTFSIVGSVSSFGIGETTLLTGSISSFTFGGGFFTVQGTDTKDAGLLTSLGLPPSTPFSLSGFSIGFLPSVPLPCDEGATCYQVISTDILNTSVDGGVIPEPTTLVLLGGGLLGLARARRRSA